MISKNKRTAFTVKSEAYFLSAKAFEKGVTKGIKEGLKHLLAEFIALCKKKAITCQSFEAARTWKSESFISKCWEASMAYEAEQFTYDSITQSNLEKNRNHSNNPEYELGRKMMDLARLQ